MTECKHEETKTQVTKSGVYKVCAKCGHRIEKLDERVLIEKIKRPDLLEKRIHGSSD